MSSRVPYCKQTHRRGTVDISGVTGLQLYQLPRGVFVFSTVRDIKKSLFSISHSRSIRFEIRRAHRLASKVRCSPSVQLSLS
jgi:hypothetical protein